MSDLRPPRRREPAPPDGSPLAGGLLYAVRWFAAIRLGCMAVALATDTNAGSDADPQGYDLACALGATYALALVGLAVRRPEPLLHWRRLGVVDLALLGALTYLSGGSDSPLAFAYLAVPFLVAFVARPAQTALWSLATITSYLAISRPGDSHEWFVIARLAFAALGAVAFSAVLVRLHSLVIEHARRASSLAAELVRVEARERRKLADALHDGVVQHIADAQRELASSEAGDDPHVVRAAAALERGLHQLRGEIFDLYPHVLDHVGLEGAVGELVRRAAQRGGFHATAEVDPSAAGIDDVTVMAVLRELLANVRKHADATRVDVWVSNQAGSCVLVRVRDDGRGFEPPSPEQAVAARQFGLHAAGERLRALGGSLDVLSVPGTGTDASARIPIARAA